MFSWIILGAFALAAGPDADYRSTIEADWKAQEVRRGRTAESPEAVADAIGRAESLLADLSRLPQPPDLSAEKAAVARLKPQAERAASLTDAARWSLYRELRWAARSAALKHPQLANRPLVFLTRHRFICQMLHEYLGYFCDYGDVEGGGVFVLEEPGRSMRTHDLIRGRLPRGNYMTLSLSFDARTVWFAFSERAQSKPNFYSPDRRCFHLYAVDPSGENLRQVTEGPNDDFDPCPLPDGGVAFVSTRRGGFARCNNPWEPLPSYTLHRMDSDGQNIRTLSWHETSEWHPSVLADGRIAYTRWDYVDRSAANYHGIWTCNPDGSNPQSLFGNYTERINACYQPRAIPGSKRIAFIAGAHHADVGGSLVVLDPERAGLDAKTGEDSLGSIEVLTPEVCFPEAPGWPTSYFHSPWPLAEGYYLVSFSFDPLPGMSAKAKTDSPTGLYYFDRFGNMELLYRQEGISAMYPVPLSPRPLPPVIPSALDAGLGNEGELLLADVNASFHNLPAERRIASVRVYQILPKSETHTANQPRIGYANAESARMLLGTVPVESDGSANFRVPAGKPLYFQAVDGEGRAVQTMRSITYLQPGERRGCVGCHERPKTTPSASDLLAGRRGVSVLTPGPDGTLPFSYARLVQPVLNRHCVRCHDGTPAAKSPLSLLGEPAGEFSASYKNLEPFVRWYEWGGKSISQAVTVPGRCGADESRLMRVLNDDDHRDIALPAEDRLRLTIWLDGNAPFYGTYSKQERAAQHCGEAVPPPVLQ